MQNNQKVKKKRISRKLKSSWRKNVDITDVEEFLEEQRQEERIGSVADKSDLELFSIEPSHSKKSITIKEKRKKLLDAAPKCYAALENTSKVCDPIAKRNFKINKDKKLQSVKKIIVKQPAAKKKVDLKKMKKSFKTDLWDDEEDELSKAPRELTSEWCNKELVLHTLTNTGKPLVKMHKTLHENFSKLSAIAKPHPGTSYNPTFDDHQDLVEKVIEREDRIIKTEQHLNRCVTDKYTKISAEEKEKLIYQEMSEGLNLNDTNENKDADQDENEEHADEEYRAINPPVRNKKKDKKAKRKKSEAIERANQKQMVECELKKFKDINKITDFKKDMEKATNKTIKKKINRKIRVEEKDFNSRRVAYQQYEEPELDFTDAKDLTCNLRNLKPEGSLMVDRYKSLQKRNIIPPKKFKGKTVKARPRNRIGKFAKYTLKSHKETQ